MDAEMLSNTYKEDLLTENSCIIIKNVTIHEKLTSNLIAFERFHIQVQVAHETVFIPNSLHFFNSFFCAYNE